MTFRDALCDSTVGKRFYSPFKNCSALVMDERGQEVMQEFECPHYHRIFCAHCRVLCHTGLSCGRFQEMFKLGKEKKQESMFLELAKKSRWQRCPKCMFYVEKASGCMSIKCSERRGPSCRFLWQGPSHRFSLRGQSYKFSWQHRQRVNLDNQYIIKEDFNTIGALVNSSPRVPTSAYLNTTCSFKCGNCQNL